MGKIGAHVNVSHLVVQEKRATRRLVQHLPKLMALSDKTLNENLIAAKKEDKKDKGQGLLPLFGTESKFAWALIRLKRKISKNPEDAEKAFKQSIDHRKWNFCLFDSMSKRILQLAKVRQGHREGNNMNFITEKDRSIISGIHVNGNRNSLAGDTGGMKILDPRSRTFSGNSSSIRTKEKKRR